MLKRKNLAQGFIRQHRIPTRFLLVESPMHYPWATALLHGSRSTFSKESPCVFSGVFRSSSCPARLTLQPWQTYSIENHTDFSGKHSAAVTLLLFAHSCSPLSIAMCSRELKRHAVNCNVIVLKLRNRGKMITFWGSLD